MTLAEITEKAAQHVCKRNGIERRYPGESWVAVLAWNTSVYIEEEDAFREIVSAALQIEWNKA